MLLSNNVEAPTTCDSQGFGIEQSKQGNIDMDIVAKSDLNFQGIHLQPIDNMAETWLTASQIGYALQYSDDKAVQRIYSRHADEFTEKMTGVVKVTTPYGEQMTRAFSLRGAHLIAMFARTTKAKEFRQWVLDVLDREVVNSPSASQFSDGELYSLAALWSASVVMYEACQEVSPLLNVAEHKMAPRFCSIGTNFSRTIKKARELLKRETEHIDYQSPTDSYWTSVLPNIRRAH